MLNIQIFKKRTLQSTLQTRYVFEKSAKKDLPVHSVLDFAIKWIMNVLFLNMALEKYRSILDLH